MQFAVGRNCIIGDNKNTIFMLSPLQATYSSSNNNITFSTMATSTISSSSSKRDDAYTTITETVRFEKEIKRNKFNAVAGRITNEASDSSPGSGFRLSVKDSRATHNCWAYKVGDQYDGEPSGTAGKPIHSAIVSSGIDRVMVVVIRHFGGIKLGTGGLVRAYGGVASECLRNAPTCLAKSKLQHFQVEDIKQDYETGKDGTTMVTFKVDFDLVENLEEAIKSNCSRELLFYKN